MGNKGEGSMKTNQSAKSIEAATLDDALAFLEYAAKEIRALQANILQGKGPDGRKLDRESTIAVVALGAAASALMSPENYASLLKAIREGRLPRKDKPADRVRLRVVGG